MRQLISTSRAIIRYVLMVLGVPIRCLHVSFAELVKKVALKRPAQGRHRPLDATMVLLLAINTLQKTQTDSNART